KLLRPQGGSRAWPAPPGPLPTVTLAEIYSAQGHFDRALAVLDELLQREPDHQEAQALRARLLEHTKGRFPAAASPDAATSANHPKKGDAPQSEVRADEPSQRSRGTVEVDSAPVPNLVPTSEEPSSSAPLALPDRYDVDEIVALAVDPTSIF